MTPISNFFTLFEASLTQCIGMEAGQQKLGEHGSGALRKWQTKLRKWCKLGEKNKKRKKGQKEMRKKEERKKKRKRERKGNTTRT